MTEVATTNLPAIQSPSRAQQAISKFGGTSYIEMLEYLERHENLMTEVTPDNKDDAMLFKSVADEIGGKIKDHKAAGKLAREDATKFSKEVIATENEIADPAEKMKDFFMAGYKSWKVADDERKAAKRERLQRIEAAIGAITALPGTLLNASSQEIQAAHDALKARDMDAEGTFQEFAEKAKEEQAKALEAMQTAFTRAVVAEEQAKQLAEMQRQQEEFERKKAEFAEQQRQAELAKQAAENARLQAERDKAEAEARALREAEEKRQQEEAARIAAEEKAAAEKAEAARQAELAPDKDKLIKFADDIEEIAVNGAPSLGSNEANDLMIAALASIKKITAQIKDRAQAL